jgi:hypothetical protein
MQEPEKKPLIIMLRMDDNNMAFFNAQRRTYFPPGGIFCRPISHYFIHYLMTRLLLNIYEIWRTPLLNFSLTV